MAFPVFLDAFGGSTVDSTDTGDDERDDDEASESEALDIVDEKDSISRALPASDGPNF